MLREMPASLFYEWLAYAELEPFDEKRADLRTADIVRVLSEIHRDSKKRRKPVTIDDVVLRFGDDTREGKEVKEKPTAQSWQTMKFIAQQWVALANAKPKRRRR